MSALNTIRARTLLLMESYRAFPLPAALAVMRPPLG